MDLPATSHSGNEADVPHLRMEDKLWTVDEVEVPDASYAVWVGQRQGILVVCRDAQFWKLW